MKYYNYIAGLPDLKQFDFKGIPGVAELKNELYSVLSKHDAIFLQLLFYRYDNKNLLLLQKNRHVQIDPKGNLSKEDWSQIFQQLDEGETLKNLLLASYLKKFLVKNADEDILAEVSQEDYLSALYYDFAAKSTNVFLRKWFEFNLDLNNIITAFICRKYDYDLNKLIVGQNKTARALRKNTSPDFGLRFYTEAFDDIMLIVEEQDPAEKEIKIDLLKWKWLEENTLFSYFEVENILAYVLQAEIIERWKTIAVSGGAEIFNQLIDSLKKDIVVKV